jgi:hypothetical protein
MLHCACLLCTCAGSYDDRGLLEDMDLGGEDAEHRHYLAALLDAESALDLDPAFPKAYLRKAQALLRLDRYGEALAAAEAGRSKAAGTGCEAELAALIAEVELLHAGPPEPDLYAMD